MRLTTPENQRVVPVDVVDNVSTALGIAAQGLAATLAHAYIGVLANGFGRVMRRLVAPETVRIVFLYRPLERSVAGRRGLCGVSPGLARALGTIAGAVSSRPSWCAAAPAAGIAIGRSTGRATCCG